MNEIQKTGLRLWMKVTLVLGLVAAVLATSYVAYAEQYADNFLEGTFINGMNVSNMTAFEVEETIRDQVEGYNIELTFVNGQTETISGNQIGLTYESDGTVTDVLAQQNKYSWISGKLLGSTMEYQAEEAYSYDEELLRQALNALPELQPENMTAPVNAYMQMGEDNRFEIVPEDNGSTLNGDVIFEALNAAVAQGQTSLDITSLENVYTTAELKSDNEDLNNQVNLLNQFLDTTITYELYDGSSYVLDSSVTKDWLTPLNDGANNYTIDGETVKTKAAEYIQQMAAEKDEVKTTTTFQSTNKGAVELECEPYGHKIDQTAETEALYGTLMSFESQTKSPEYSLNSETGGFGDLFIEIDIDNQHVYVHQGDSIIFDTACVTGTETSASRRTPRGVSQIYWKTTNRYLRGQIDPSTGEPSYISFVNYWMPFNGGVGLHDATWRSEFGGSIYQYSGSHGCINLPKSAAAEIYSMVSVGTYVIVL